MRQTAFQKQLNSIWHDKEEKPSKKKIPCKLAYIDFAGELDYLEVEDMSDYTYHVSHYGLDMWAYIDDIYPDKWKEKLRKYEESLSKNQ